MKKITVTNLIENSTEEFTFDWPVENIDAFIAIVYKLFSMVHVFPELEDTKQNIEGQIKNFYIYKKMVIANMSFSLEDFDGSQRTLEIEDIDVKKPFYRSWNGISYIPETKLKFPISGGSDDEIDVRKTLIAFLENTFIDDNLTAPFLSQFDDTQINSVIKALNEGKSIFTYGKVITVTKIQHEKIEL